MIRYALKCSNDHSFESWFKSAEAFDSLKAAKLVACPICEDTSVEKSLMAPRVRPARNKAKPAPVPVPAETPQPMAASPDPEIAKAIKEIREHVEKNSDYVGDKFVQEARSMHNGETPHRPIYGEAKAEEAKKLVEDGVPALPLPFIPKQKTN